MAAHLLAGAAMFASTFAFPTSQSHTTTNVDSPASTHYVVPQYPRPGQYGGSDGHSYFSPAWIPHGQNLHPQLPQSRTNGNSSLGTFGAPRLPPWLSHSPPPTGPGSNSWSPPKTPAPWGSACGQMPNTGVTRHYDFTVTEQEIAPDGVVRQGLVVNGAFPGPTIEANWGDWIEVVVHNQLPNEGTSMHWHGLLQTNSAVMDGVPSVTQCPIAPGQTFTYRFRADLFGSSWYHSHYSAQYAGGILGAMIIHGPTDNAHYDVDLGPVLLGDWYHEPYFDLVEQVMAPISAHQLPPASTNNLINGKMNYPCANATGYQCTPNAGISKFQIESGKTYRLRLINTGAEGIQKFSIDGYTLKVIANDFIPIVPYETEVVTLGVGQRSDVLLTANGKPTDSMWMRANLGISAFEGGCTINDGVSPMAVAAMYYQDANTTSVPNTTYTVSDSVLNSCQNDALTSTTPFCALPVNPNFDAEVLNITYQSNGTNDLFFVNNSTFRANYNDPILLEAKLGHTEYPGSCNVHSFPSSKAIRFVVYNYALTGAHPMHMHGHNIQILAVGSGIWDGTVTNAQNPQRRDVQLLPNAVSPTEPSYIVVQFEADNPGVWPFHCHIAWHVSAGLYINVLEGQQTIEKEMVIPKVMAQTCRDWAAWTGTNIPDEIDSGL